MAMRFMRRKLNLQTKMFVYYSILIIALVTVSIAFLNSYITRIYQERSIENLNDLMLKTSEQVDSILSHMDAITLQVVNNPIILEEFAKIATLDDPTNAPAPDAYATRQKIINTLMAINGPNVSVDRFSLISTGNNYVSFGILLESAAARNEYLRTAAISDLIATLRASERYRIILPPHRDFWSDSHDEPLISIYRIVKDIDTGHEYGVIETQLRYKRIENLFTNLNGSRAYLYSEKGAAVFPDQKASDDDPALTAYYRETISERPNGAFTAQNPVSKKREYISFLESSYSGWTLVFVQDEDILAAPARLIGTVLVLIGLSGLMLALTFTLLISNQLAKPIKRLRRSIDSVNLANLSIEIEGSDENNEILQLSKTFDAMFKRIKDSFAQEINAHFMALQSQMNPHFVNNMLAHISAAGQESGDARIVDICLRLSNMLRYTATLGKKETTIEDELHHASDYLALMKERYQDYISYEMTIDESALPITVPKLILQPLLENCFQHGFSKVNPPWRIHILIARDARNWWIQVTDNGAGIDASLLSSLVEEYEKYSQDPYHNEQGIQLGGLGLKNIYIRLRLLYRDDIIFRIEDLPEGGASITIGGTAND